MSRDVLTSVVDNHVLVCDVHCEFDLVPERAERSGLWLFLTFPEDQE